MATPDCERAIEDAIKEGNALLKFISRNDASVTGHQAGFYLPKANDVWKMYSPHPPKKGVQNEEIVDVTWPDGRVTKSKLTWYGHFAKDPKKPGRAEYRLTRFGKDFPYLNANTVGDLFILIPLDHFHFRAYVLDDDDDIEEFQSALGVEAFGTWGVYRGGKAQVEDEGECIERHFKNFAVKLKDFPSGKEFSGRTLEILADCVKGFGKQKVDDALLRALKTEYSLFQYVERKLCAKDVVRAFKDIDDFLKTAARIMNRRKARAGRSLENHIEQFLKNEKVPHEMRSQKITGRPDIVIPSIKAYDDQSYPVGKLFVVGVKTTCKDRWRQVLNEGKRVPTKHIITTQQGISVAQMQEMKDAQVSLVVPKKLHEKYPKKRPMQLLSVEDFVSTVRATLG